MILTLWITRWITTGFMDVTSLYEMNVLCFYLAQELKSLDNITEVMLVLGKLVKSVVSGALACLHFGTVRIVHHSPCRQTFPACVTLLCGLIDV